MVFIFLSTILCCGQTLDVLLLGSPSHMPDTTVSTLMKSVNTARRLGDNGDGRLQNSSLWNPTTPAMPIPYLHITMTIQADDKDLKSIMCTGYRTDNPDNLSTQRFPAFPSFPIPPLMPHRIVGTDTKEIDAIATPRYSGGSRDEGASKRTPSSP